MHTCGYARECGPFNLRVSLSIHVATWGTRGSLASALLQLPLGDFRSLLRERGNRGGPNRHSSIRPSQVGFRSLRSTTPTLSQQGIRHENFGAVAWPVLLAYEHASL